MGRAFGWFVAFGLALGASGAAGAATLPPMSALPLNVDAMPSVAAPPPASFQLSGSESPSIWGQPSEPATLMMVATGLAGLVVLGHREFV
jgi:hypothetical protein